jgi:hypothetical protein
MDSSITCSSELYNASEIGFACLLNSLEVILDEKHLRNAEIAPLTIEKLVEKTPLLCSRLDKSRIQLLRSKIDRVFWVANRCSLKSYATEWSMSRVCINEASELSSASDLCHKDNFDSCYRLNMSFTPNSIQNLHETNCNATMH